MAIFMDVFTRCIHGRHLSRHLGKTLAITALQRALTHGRLEIHHSDQGVQYATGTYVELLEAAEVAASMAGVGAAWQNGHVERMIRTIKEEEVC